MSRNKQQGRYAGKLRGKHYRTHSKSVHVSRLDCHLELAMKEYRQASDMFARMGGIGGVFRMLGGYGQ